jgi:uncharacterized protein (DUF2147 family)
MTARAMKTLLLALAGLACAAASAQMTPVGRWQTVDEKTGEPKSQVVIVERGGVLSGRIDKLLRPGADPAVRCTVCSDDRKDQLMLGLEIIRNAQKVQDRDVWEGGRVLDPEAGKNYTLRLTPIEAGAKLEVRGSFGPFSRTQTWTRVP